LSLGLWLLGGCGHPGVVERPLYNANSAADGAGATTTTLMRSGEWELFYFDCMQAAPCNLDLSVGVHDATLAAVLTKDAGTRPMGSLLKTSQLLLYTAQHEVDLRFDQGIYRDPTTGRVSTQDSVTLPDQPSNLRYHVSVAFPTVNDADAMKVLPDALEVDVRAAWK
jgi:hypothetical protein